MSRILTPGELAVLRVYLRINPETGVVTILDNHKFTTKVVGYMWSQWIYVREWGSPYVSSVSNYVRSFCKD